MTAPHKPTETPTLALPVAEAARAVGVAEHAFREHVLPELRSVKVGRHTVVTVRELERWLDLNGRFRDEE